jgi:hypothetical protein
MFNDILWLCGIQKLGIIVVFLKVPNSFYFCLFFVVQQILSSDRAMRNRVHHLLPTLSERKNTYQSSERKNTTPSGERKQHQ